MISEKSEIGVIGIGVMGGNLVLNIAGHGYPVSGYDREASKVQALMAEAARLDGMATGMIRGAANLKEFFASLAIPRKVMMLVPAGPTVDSLIQEITPYLDPGDVVIDGGNSYFKDTDSRARSLAARKIDYLGIGISGGESGALYGPSLMAGGSFEAYQKIEPILKEIAARAHGEPCVA